MHMSVDIFVPYPVHADIGALLHIPDRNSGFLQFTLKAKAASLIETHHVWQQAVMEKKKEVSLIGHIFQAF